MAGTLITDQRSANATYKILRRLGKGGMAEVFLARQEGMAGFRRLAVVKKILPQFSTVTNVAEMLLDEARIVAQLNHPNVVQIYELGKDGSQYFIAMEFVDGCDLATLARIERHRKSRVPMRLALRVVSEAAMGLDYAHRQVGLDGRPLNIVHRDVSPHNILCSREGAVKVTDFGIAKAVGKEQITEVGVVKGKVQYMAPEQYTGGEVDARSDIFSLGVVLYQLSTGRLPRVTKSGNVAMRRVVEGNIPRPSEVRSDYPEELEGILMRALAHHPDERYPDAAAFRDDVLEFARQNDMLAFPKELGEYIDELVPPRPLLETDDDRPASVIISRTLAREDAPEVSVPTGPPPNTEVVPRPTFGSKQAPSASPAPLSVPEQPSVAPAEEELTPVKGYDTVPDREPAFAKHAAEEVSTKSGRTRRTTDPVTQPRRAPRPSGRPYGWLAALVVVAVAAAGFYIYVARMHPQLAIHPPVPRPLVPDAPTPTPPGPAIGAGSIEIVSAPKEARVAVDGAQRCSVTPCRIANLPLGRELYVTVRAPRHNLWQNRVVLTATDPKLLLTPELTPSTLPDKPPPTKGSKVGKKPPHKGGKRPAGSKAKRGTGKVVVVAADNGLSLLAVDVRPAWAEVWIDGKKIGVTPVVLQIEPGRRLVELKNEEFKFHRRYKVRAAKGKKIKISDTIEVQQPAPQ